MNTVRKGAISVPLHSRKCWCIFCQSSLAAAIPDTCVSLCIDRNLTISQLYGSRAELVAGAWGGELCLPKPPYKLSATSYSDCMGLLWLVRRGPQSGPGPWGPEGVLRWLLQDTAAPGLFLPCPAGMQSQRGIGMGKRVVPEAFLYATVLKKKNKPKKNHLALCFLPTLKKFLSSCCLYGTRSRTGL